MENHVLEIHRAVGRIEGKVDQLSDQAQAADEARQRHSERLDDIEEKHSKRINTLEKRFWWAVGAVSVIAFLGPEVLKAYLP